MLVTKIGKPDNLDLMGRLRELGGGEPISDTTLQR